MYVDKKIAFIPAASITPIADLAGSTAVQCIHNMYMNTNAYANT